MVCRRVALSLVFAALVLALPEPLLRAQAPRSASTTMAVSVNVIRPCSVSTPVAAPAPASLQAPEALVRVDCGRGSSSASQVPGLLPRGAARIPATLETSQGANGLLVSVNF